MIPMPKTQEELNAHLEELGMSAWLAGWEAACSSVAKVMGEALAEGKVTQAHHDAVVRVVKIAGACPSDLQLTPQKAVSILKAAAWRRQQGAEQ